MGKGEHTVSENDKICTPACVLDPIYEHFGPIGLDPFANSKSLVLAKQYVMLPRNTPDLDYPDSVHVGDGLEYPWDDHGLVFANGPFSLLRDDRSHKSWAQKGAQEGDEVILLVPSRTGSDWWQKYITPADVILFWRGRLKFEGQKYHAPFHIALVYWGERPELMEKAFGSRHWRVTHQ